MSSRTADRRPEWVELGHDALAKRVAGSGQREGHVRVEALETPRVRLRATDAEVELGPKDALFLVAALERGGQRRVAGGRPRPSLHPAGRLETGHRDDELRTGEPEHGWKRCSRVVMRILLGHGWEPERTADGNPAEGARLAA